MCPRRMGGRAVYTLHGTRFYILCLPVMSIRGSLVSYRFCFHVGFLVLFSYRFCFHVSFVFMSALFSCRLGIYYLLHVLGKYASTLVTAGRRESRPYHPRAHTRVDCKSAVLPSNPEGVARGKRTWTTALNTGQQSGSRTSCRSGDGATPTQFDVTQFTHNARWSASHRWRLGPELHLQSSTKKRTS